MSLKKVFHAFLGSLGGEEETVSYPPTDNRSLEEVVKSTLGYGAKLLYGYPESGLRWCSGDRLPGFYVAGSTSSMYLKKLGYKVRSFEYCQEYLRLAFKSPSLQLVCVTVRQDGNGFDVHRFGFRVTV